MNILETFNLFLRKPISILTKGLVSIVHIKAENMFSKKGINVEILKDKKAQITVVNNEKVYNLLKMVTYRASQKQEQLNSIRQTEALLELRK